MTNTAAARAEARKLAQVSKLERQLAYCDKAIAGGRMDLVVRAEQLRSQIAATLVGRCRDCHRTLTDPESVAAGIGPECAAKAA